MEKQRPAWVKDVKVFAGLTLLNAAMVFVGVLFELHLRPMPVWVECWLWASSAPVQTARPSSCPVEWKWLLFWSNPLAYGLTWWAAWRMVKLFRTKPAD